jgi:hypothetical protein
MPPARKKVRGDVDQVQKERINVAKLWYLVQNNYVPAGEASEYETILEKCNTNENLWPYGSYEVSYESHSLGFGRLIPHGMCFIRMKRSIRQTIADNMYEDIDLVNCHPSLLENLCSMFEIPIVYLKEYNQNRNSILAGNKDLKQWYIKVLNGGFVDDEIVSEFQSNFGIEVNKIHSKLIELWTPSEQFNVEIEDIRKFIVEKEAAANNLNAKIVSFLLFGIENEIRKLMQDYCLEEKLDWSVNCYDGGMSYKIANSRPFKEEDLRKMENLIEEELEIPVSLKFKSMQEEAIFIDPSLLAGHSFARFQEYKRQKFDSESYDVIKRKFESFNFFCSSEVTYYTESEDAVVPYSRTDFLNKFENMWYMGTNKKGLPEKKHFISEWVKDPLKRAYEYVGLYPPGSDLPTKIDNPNYCYSKWRGFAIEKVNTENSYAAEVNTIREHTLYLCSYNDEYRSFLEKCIVHILKYPGRKLDMVIAFKAIQGGEGKNTFWELHKTLFGEQLCYSTQNHERDWFGDFNELIGNKIWLHMEEMSKSVLIKHQKSFLAYVTSKIDTLNFKGGKKKTIPSFCNYFITFNAQGMENFPGLKRRLWIHEMDSKASIKDSVYYNRLYGYMRQLPIMRAYYDWLLANVNIENFVPSEHRPTTPYMIKLFGNSLRSPFDSFMIDVLSVWFFDAMIAPVHRFNFAEFFKMFQEKCKTDGVWCTTPQKLASSLEEYFNTFVTRKLIRGKLFFELDIDKCIDVMEEKQFMSWTDLGNSETYEDCTYVVTRPCAKSCKFKNVRSHLSYILSDEVRAVRHFRQHNETQQHLCNCRGSFLIQKNE